MSSPIKGFTVVLEDDIYKESAETIANAIYALKGVIKVVPLESDHNHMIAVSQAKFELWKEIRSVLNQL